MQNNNYEIEDICNKLENTIVFWKPNKQFLNDIKLFLEELKNIGNLNVNVYDLLVSCGSDLNWTMEYFISLNDILWFRNEGKIEFLKYINENIKELNSIIDYNCAISIHNKLCMLFELQIGEEYELNECI
jgi:hypothetical protein